MAESIILVCVWADAHSFSDFKICKLRHFCTYCDDVTDYVIDLVITGAALSQQRAQAIKAGRCSQQALKSKAAQDFA